MTTKAYRRFLFAAVMLLITVTLTFTGPAPQAAQQETCDECNARCEALAQSCTDQGYPFNVCSHVAIQCSTDCLYGACSQ